MDTVEQQNNITLEEVDQALNDAGECVLANEGNGAEESIHDLKLELFKLETKKITMTLDCCRDVSRSVNDNSRVVDLK